MECEDANFILLLECEVNPALESHGGCDLSAAMTVQRLHLHDKRLWLFVYMRTALALPENGTI